jgi:hypothetical protein
MWNASRTGSTSASQQQRLWGSSTVQGGARDRRRKRRNRMKRMLLLIKKCLFQVKWAVSSICQTVLLHLVCLAWETCHPWWLVDSRLRHLYRLACPILRYHQAASYHLACYHSPHQVALHYQGLEAFLHLPLYLDLGLGILLGMLQLSASLLPLRRTICSRDQIAWNVEVVVQLEDMVVEGVHRFLVNKILCQRRLGVIDVITGTDYYETYLFR